jgi:ABC-type histidine transport system ATPase subunit
LSAEGRTIVIVTHAAEVDAVADVVVHMRDGVVTDAGPDPHPGRVLGMPDGPGARAPDGRARRERQSRVAQG